MVLITEVRSRRGAVARQARFRSSGPRSGRGAWPSYDVWRRAVPYAFQLKRIEPPDATERNVYAARRSYR
jgi:hypothetical protein